MNFVIIRLNMNIRDVILAMTQTKPEYLVGAAVLRFKALGMQTVVNNNIMWVWCGFVSVSFGAFSSEYEW